MYAKFAKFFLSAVIVSISSAIVHSDSANPKLLHDQATALFKDGNYKDALEIFIRLAIAENPDEEEAAKDFSDAVACMKNLNKIEDFDAFAEEVAEKRKSSWIILKSIADEYTGVVHDGQALEGVFFRGQGNRSGKYLSCWSRDYVRAFQLYLAALNCMPVDAPSEDRYALLMKFASAFKTFAGYGERNEYWKFQYLTDLSKLPDYDEETFRWGWRSYGDFAGAPVDKDGNPVFYQVPANFADARNDGERWRFLLETAKKSRPEKSGEVDLVFAGFLDSQFGVQTLGYSFWNSLENTDGDSEDEESSVSAAMNLLSSLSDDETVAKLASGIKRFRLPDEFNPIKICIKVSEGDDRSAESALGFLASIYTSRMQLKKAAKLWRENISRFGDDKNKTKEESLNAIVGNWGVFEDTKVQPGTKKGLLPFKFRNARKVSFKAIQIDVEKLIGDIKKYMKSNPKQVDYERLQIENIGWRLVNKNMSKYIKRTSAEWELELSPLENHFDKRILVETPIDKPGAYLVSAYVENGNTSRIILWLADTAIVTKKCEDGELYYVADAESGKPIPEMRLDFFGYQIRYNDYKTSSRRTDVIVCEHDSKVDGDGLFLLDPKKIVDSSESYNWLCTATSPEGRFAYFGFNNIWLRGKTHQKKEPEKTVTYFITDKPVYRPNDTVRVKCWIRKASYLDESNKKFCNSKFFIVVRDPKGEELVKNQLQSDNYGGMEFDWKLQKNAMLGNYSIFLETVSNIPLGSSYFRVEEYKKPEFEVKALMPEKPAKLGDNIEVKISARYYFGAPVANAKVKYKIQRTVEQRLLWPARAWDWLYGNGYWWFYPGYSWLSGCRGSISKRDFHIWPPRSSAPPELVASNECEIREDGTVEIKIDSSIAKELFGRRDQRYEITAEVTDQSRRTITGKGAIVAAVEPLKVMTWTDKGFYEVGDTVFANFAVHTADGKPFPCKATVRLQKIIFNDTLNPEESDLLCQELEIGESSSGELKFNAAQKGQFKLLCEAVSEDGAVCSGAVVFNVIDREGAGEDSRNFRYNKLELICEKPEYAVGDKARLLVNSERENAVVLLFIRPSDGAYPKPIRLDLKGKSAIYEFDIEKEDMPNIFAEALTVYDTQVFTENVQIAVPPDKKVLDVEIFPSKEKYAPDEKATAKIKVSDMNGRPVVGNLVVAIYDKALEYISGGSNVPEIKGHFWGWKRFHHPGTRSSLENVFRRILKQGDKDMPELGFLRHANIFPGAMAMRSSSADFRSKGIVHEDVDGLLFCAGLSAESPQTFGRSAEAVPSPAGTDAIIGPEIVVRSYFADSALWIASLETTADGAADIALNMPQNLTTWKIKVWSLTDKTQVGFGETEIITTRDFIVRMQSPRFFTEGDIVTLSANIHNYLGEDIRAAATLELSGGTLEIHGDNNRKNVLVPANGEARVDWKVKALREGDARITMKAFSSAASDGISMDYPVKIHGIEKMLAKSGVLKNEDESAKFAVSLPDEIKPAETRFELRYSPTLAGAMLEALPFLLDYPYGCTEQTLNRFLSAAITRKTLMDLGVNLAELEGKISNLNPQELGDDNERIKQRGNPILSPVFDREKLDNIISESLAKLEFMQNGDGGWGWFSGYGEYSDPHTTSLIVHGLRLCQELGIEVSKESFDRGIAWLTQYRDCEIRKLKNADKKKKPFKSSADEIDALVNCALAENKMPSKDMNAFLMRDKNNLSVYGLTLLGLALEKSQDVESLSRVMKNIEQYLEQDDENQTAWLKLRTNFFWWSWSGSEIETMAHYLKLLVACEPKNELCPKIVKYLLNNRAHATYWNSTRDTAFCIEAFANYLHATGEMKPEMDIEIRIDGKLKKSVRVDAENLFTFDNKLVMTGENFPPGKHEIEIFRKGAGPLYYNSYLSFFTLEKFIRKSGLEIKIDRKFYLLKEAEAKFQARGKNGAALLLDKEKYERVEIASGTTLKNGDLLEVELLIESKNDYEHIIVEDMKAAGFEPCEVRSGYNGNELGAYVEFRDDRVCFFVRALPLGRHSVSYRLRAETPGSYSALPAKAWGMYAPELKAISDEFKPIINE